MEEIQNKLVALVQYRGELAANDRVIFDKLMRFAKDQVSVCTQVSNLNLLESLLLAVMIEQQKKIDKLSVRGAS